MVVEHAPQTVAAAERAESSPQPELARLGLAAVGTSAAGGHQPPAEPGLLRIADPQARAGLVLGLQRLHGNRHVQRLLAGQAAAARSWLTLQRQNPASAAAAPEDEPLSAPPVHRELPGAGFDVQRQAATAGAAIQRQSQPGAVRAQVNLTVSSPTVSVAPGAQIGAAHGRLGAVGWTTPSYDVRMAAGSTRTNITVNVELGFQIELPSDYDSERQAVVSDHEIGHVRIGERKAKQFLVDGLKSMLQAHGEPHTEASFSAAVTQATQDFADAEGQGSQSYDAADYPRMVEAYRGVRTPLRQLAAQSAAIAVAMGVLRRAPGRLHSAVRGYDTAGVQGVADQVASSRAALAAQELWRLQYNREFQGLVSNTNAAVTSYLSGFGLLGSGLTELPEAMKPPLEAIRASLGGYGFSPTGASASF